ncbi:MAG: hypothetical protein V1859_10555 [archaeon]
MTKELMKKLGVYAFLAGIVIALATGVITGFMSVNGETLGLVSGLMVLLGIVVGAMNISDKEVNSFVIAAIGLASGSMAIAGLGPLLPITPIDTGKIVTTAFTIFSVFVAGAVFVPALKSIYKLSKD